MGIRIRRNSRVIARLFEGLVQALSSNNPADPYYPLKGRQYLIRFRLRLALGSAKFFLITVTNCNSQTSIWSGSQIQQESPRFSRQQKVDSRLVRNEICNERTQHVCKIYVYCPVEPSCVASVNQLFAAC